jgi:hypothetical protein
MGNINKMRLYVNAPGHKVYLAAYAATRCELAQKLSDRFSVKMGDGWNDYAIEDVYAEPASHLDLALMMIGGLVGLVAGPLGVVFGALAGYLLGINEGVKEKHKVRIFNECHIRGTYDAPSE